MDIFVQVDNLTLEITQNIKGHRVPIIILRKKNKVGESHFSFQYLKQNNNNQIEWFWHKDTNGD
jgi:hypothetical protein